MCWRRRKQADDADNTLRRGMGNEAAHADLKEFERRFACRLLDAYGSTEGGVATVRNRDTPTGSLGLAMTSGMKVMNPATMTECEQARLMNRGRLLNADQAIGELVNTEGVPAFEGYWKNDEANAKRTRAVLSGWAIAVTGMRTGTFTSLVGTVTACVWTVKTLVPRRSSRCWSVT